MFAVAQLCWAILLANSALAKEPTATDKSLRLAVIHIEVPPYIYTDENQEYKGIYPLVAQALGREMGLQLIYVPTARNGLEELISEGKADLTWLSPNWVKNTQDANFIFSDPILVHREFLFSFVPFDSSKGISDWLDNKSVCVRQDYQYPSLKPFFDKKIAHPIEVSSQTPMMNLFRKGRCDLLYSDEYRVTWMSQRLNLKRKIWRSDLSLEDADLSLMFNQKWRGRMSEVNQVIAQLKRSGELDAMLKTSLTFNP